MRGKVQSILSKPQTLLALGITLALLLGVGIYLNLPRRPALSPAQREWLTQKGKIVIAGDYAFPPFEYLEGREYKGFNVDLVYSLALNLGIEVELRPMLWEDARKALEEGQVDAIQGMRYTPERAAIYSFSRPFIQSYSIIFIPAERQGISSVNDLKGLRVAVQKGDVSHDYLSVLSEITIVAVGTQEEGLKLLLEGQVDAFVGNKWVGLFNLKKLGAEGKIKTVGAPLFPSPYCMAVKKGNDELLSILNTGIEILEKNGTLAILYQKWFGATPEISPTTLITPTLIKLSGLAVFLLLTSLFLYAWNLTLRQAVRKSITAEKALQERLKALYELSRKLPLLPDEAKIAQTVAEIARDIMQVSSCSLWLRDEDKGIFVEVEGGGEMELSPSPESPLNRIIRTGEPIYIPDLSKEPINIPLPSEAQSCFLAPIQTAGKIYGFLAGAKSLKDGFPPEEQELMKALAEQASVALENVRLRYGLKTQLQDLAREVAHRSLIQEIASLAVSTFDVKRILNVTAAKIVETLGVDHCAIVLFNLEKMEGTVEAEYPVRDSIGLKFDLKAYPAFSYIIKTCKPLIVSDVETEPLLEPIRNLLLMAGVRSFLLAPILLQENVIGSIGLEAKGEKRPFSPVEVELIQAITNQLAMAIHNSRLYQEIQARYHQLASLQDSIRVLNSYLDLPGMLSLLTGLTIGLLDADRSAVFLFDESKKLRCVANEGLSPAFVSLLESVQIWPPTLKEAPPPLIVNDILKEALFLHIRGAAMDEGIASALYLPLFHRGNLLGHLAIFNDEPRTFSPAEVSLARSIAEQAAVAINNALLFQKLKKAGEEWETTFNGIREGIVLLNPDFQILRANEAFSKLVGLSPREVVGRSIYEVLPSFPEIHLKEEHPYIPRSKEIQWRFKDQTFRIIHYPIRGETGLLEKVIVILEDITEELVLQNRLLQSHTLASLGKMASALAHELNNPLAVILGYASLLQLEPVPDKVKEALKEMEYHAQRASNIVKAIADFAEQKTVSRLKMNVNQILEKALAFHLSELKASNIEVFKEFDPNLPETGGDPYQLQQAFEQIIINAQQALESRGRGKLLIRTSKEEKPEPTIKIEFINDGPQIPEEIMPYIFSPFFTTKEGKEGLGLSLAYGVIARHGGSIWAENLPEGGVRFQIELPIVTPEPDWALKTLKEIEYSSLVLLIGKSLRLVELEKTLSSWGYRCLKAHGLKEAEELVAKEKPAAILCIFTPDFQECFDLYQKLVGAEPGLAKKFLFLVEGRLTPEISRLLKATAGIHLVEPVDPEVLRRTLGKIIFTTEG